MKKLKNNNLYVFLLIFVTNTNAQWSSPDLTLTGRAIQCFINVDSTTLAGTNGGLVRTTNNGTNWANIGGGLPYPNVRALLKVESYPFDLVAGMVSGRISQSTNHGDNWTGFPIDNYQMPFLASVNSILKNENSSQFFAGTEHGAYILPQYYPATNWIEKSDGLPSVETKVRKIVQMNGEIFCGTNSGVFHYNGATWDEKNSGLTNTNVTALNYLDTILIVGTSQGSVAGIYLSNDGGNNWNLSLNDPWITSILILGANIFVGSYGNGIWRSTNYGVSWSQINDGLASGAYYVLSLGSDNQYLFAGTNGSSIWRRPLSQSVTEVETEANISLKNFSLSQNYPNPFNPSTKISWQSPGSSHQILKVYDALGNEVATLIIEERPAGKYEVNFDALNLSSGIYFYQLQAGEFISTKKMTLLK